MSHIPFEPFYKPSLPFVFELSSHILPRELKITFHTFCIRYNKQCASKLSILLLFCIHYKKGFLQRGNLHHVNFTISGNTGTIFQKNYSSKWALGGLFWILLKWSHKL